MMLLTLFREAKPHAGAPYEMKNIYIEDDEISIFT